MGVLVLDYVYKISNFLFNFVLIMVFDILSWLVKTLNKTYDNWCKNVLLHKTMEINMPNIEDQ